MSALVKELVEAGVHYGHRASRWNPKMRPYIYARKNLIHIIDVRETVRGLLRAKKYLQQVSLARQPGAVCRHQASGGRRDRKRGAAGGNAVCQRSLAGRHAHELSHDSQPADAVGRAGSDPRQRTNQHVLQENAVGTQSRVPQDVPQPERHSHDEPVARVLDHRRSKEGEERRQRGPEAGRSPRSR